MFAQGDEGTWERDVLKGLKEDPNGPQIDLRTELIQHLGRRISVLTDYQLPITTTSDRLLFAIEVTNPKAVSLAIEKLMKNDPTVQPRDQKGNKLAKDDPTLHDRAEKGQIIWEMVEDETAAAIEAPKVEIFGGGPTVAPAHPLRKKKAPEEDEEEEEQRLLPHAALTVWQGHLFIASHVDFLLKVVRRPRSPTR